MVVWWFYVPNIVFGEDALTELETIDGKKAFIVTDNVVNSLGLPEKVCSILTERQWEVAIWDGVEPDPKVSTVNAAAEAIKRFGADWIIAIGGGSAMDTAKAAWILYEKPDVELHAGHGRVAPEDPRGGPGAHGSGSRPAAPAGRSGGLGRPRSSEGRAPTRVRGGGLRSIRRAPVGRDG